MDRRVVLLGLVAAHLVVAAVHGTAHALVPVRLTAWGNAVVVATTFVGPVVGLALAWRGHPLGVPVFTASMAGTLALGGVLRFLVENPDHVHARRGTGGCRPVARSTRERSPHRSPLLHGERFGDADERFAGPDGRLAGDRVADAVAVGGRDL